MGSGYSSLSTIDDNDIIMASMERDLGNCQASTSNYSTLKNRPIIRTPVHLKAINWLAPVRSGMILSASSDKTIVLNNMDTGACVMRWRGHQREVTKVVYKHVGCKHFILSASKDCTIRLWNFDVDKECHRFNDIGKISVTGLAAIDDCKFVAGCRDGTISLWDLETQQLVRKITISNNLVTHIGYQSHSNIFCQTSEDGSLRLWDSRTLSLIHKFPTKAHCQWHCDMFLNSEYILSSGAGNSNDGSEITLWDLRQHKLLREYFGHESDVRCSVILEAPQQITWKRLILSVSTDKTAKLWNLNNGQCLWTETFGAELNSCLGFSDGSISIGGENSTLCDMRLMKRAGRPYLICNAIQSINQD